MHSSKETRGGARLNAGRKKGSSLYGESTLAVRIPESLIPTIKTLLNQKKHQFEKLGQLSTAFLFPPPTPEN